MNLKLVKLQESKRNLDSIRVVFSEVQVSNRDFIRISDLGVSEETVMENVRKHNIKYQLARILGETTLTIDLDENKEENIIAFLDEELASDKERHKTKLRYRKEYNAALEDAKEELAIVRDLLGTSTENEIERLCAIGDMKYKTPGTGCGALRRKAMRYYEKERGGQAD